MRTWLSRIKLNPEDCDTRDSILSLVDYGDFGSGRIWGLRYDGTSLEGPYVQVNNTGLKISAFGQDSSGEVYELDLFGGGIYVLQPVHRRTMRPISQLLSLDKRKIQFNPANRSYL